MAAVHVSPLCKLHDAVEAEVYASPVLSSSPSEVTDHPGGAYARILLAGPE